jgi:hypothetical protein
MNLIYKYRRRHKTVSKMSKPPNRYTCAECVYSTPYKTAFTKHLNSNKHRLAGLSLKSKYECKLCSYKTNESNKYARHVESQRHKNNFRLSRSKEVERFHCDTCTNSYKYKSGLSRHKKKCKLSKILSKEEFDELKTVIVDSVAESAGAHPPTTIVNNHVGQVNQNVQINMIQFLNSNYSGAMNITDFIDNIKLQLTDLQRMSREGFASSAKGILSSRIQEMDVSERPIHCTDRRKKTLFIKDRDEWFEDGTRAKMAAAVRRLHRLHGDGIIEYEDSAPEGYFADEGRFREKNNMLIELSKFSGGDDDRALKQVVNSVCTAAFINPGGNERAKRVIAR